MARCKTSRMGSMLGKASQLPSAQTHAVTMQPKSADGHRLLAVEELMMLQAEQRQPKQFSSYQHHSPVETLPQDFPVLTPN